QAGLAIFGGVLLGLAYLALAFGTAWWLTPVAVTAIGLGFYALHNTLQTNATQMTPQARGTAVAIFSSALYLGQTLGVAACAPGARSCSIASPRCRCSWHPRSRCRPWLGGSRRNSDAGRWRTADRRRRTRSHKTRHSLLKKATGSKTSG